MFYQRRPQHINIPFPESEVGKINIITHFPESREEKKELEKKVGALHAQLVLERLAQMRLSCEQREKVIKIMEDKSPSL